MKSKILLYTLTLIIFASLLSACMGGTTGVASSWPGLTANGGLVYLAYGQHVYAVDYANGTEQWRFPTEVQKGAEFYAPPALTGDGQLIIGSFNHNLYSVDPATGAQKWVFEGAKDRYIAGPLVTEKGIYAPSSDGNLYALDLNGKLQWTFNTGGAIWATPSTNSECDCIYIASMDHHVYMADAETGSQLWQSEKLSGSVIGAPTFDAENELLFAATVGKEMVALNVSNGRVAWRVPTQEWVWSAPLLADGALYFGDAAGYFYSLSAADGSENWKIQPLPGSSIVGTPILVGEMIYFTSESASVYGVSSAGTVNHTYNVAAKLYTPPVWVGDKFLVAEMEGDALLVALNENGAQQWVFVPAK
jgi:outer membrane protein assembly factor BamB